jgi:hypothetical protein
MQTKTGPEAVYQVKRDRAITPRRVTPTLTVGFRVHFIVEMPGCKPVLKASKIMWEHEAAEMLANIDKMPCARRRITPYYPHGLEEIQGWAPESRPARLPHEERFEAKRRESLEAEARSIGAEWAECEITNDPTGVACTQRAMLEFLKDARNETERQELYRVALDAREQALAAH